MEFNRVADLDADEIGAKVGSFGGPFVVEVKLDGWRLQVRDFRRSALVRAFSLCQ